MGRGWLPPPPPFEKARLPEMKIALAQINPIIGDFTGNIQKIMDACKTAEQKGCGLAVFPELAVTGYPPADLLEKSHYVRANLKALDHLIQNIRGLGVVCGYVDVNPGDKGNPLFNSAVLFKDGRRLHTEQKRLLPTYDVFDERRYFEPGNSFEPVAFEGRRLGITICEDIWYDVDVFARKIYDLDPVARLKKNGADLICNISASPFHLGKPEIRQKMLSGLAKTHNLPLVYTNQVGGNDSLLFDGYSLAMGPDGEVKARAAGFKEDLIIFNTDDFSGDMRPGPESEAQSVLDALVMGVRDYLHKCGFSRAVVGLSGGVDSALTACVAVLALGRDNVTTIFMPSAYTSPDNEEDTRELARRLGVERRVWPIDPVFDAFVNLLFPIADKTGTSVTEQNIQARIRGVLLMAYSNKTGSMLLSTGNKSETAVGYCTLYGDMNGGLAVISDVPKTMVYAVCRLINQKYGHIPERILEKAPSAELAPDQRDEDDLPPYAVLDPILKHLVEDAGGEADLAAKGFDPDMVADISKRIMRNEYKRQQAAPGLKITSKAFGFGRRYPIAHLYKG